MLLNVLRKWARITPYKPAVGFNGLEFGYLDFVRLIEVCRNYLQSYELPRGSVAIVNTGAQLDGWVILIAARSLGLTTIVLEDLGKSSDLNLRGVSCVIQIETDLREFPSTIFWLAGAKLIALPVSAFSFTGEFDVPREDVRDAGGHITLTSGSTGQPKKCLFTQDQENALLADTPPIAFGTRVSLHSFALSSSSAYKKSLYVWGKGDFVSYDQRGWGAVLNDARLTDISYVPPSELPVFTKAALEAKRRPDQLSVVVGGGHAAWRLISSARQGPGWRIINNYGSTERRYMCLTELLSPEDVIWHRPADASMVEIVDSDDRPVQAGVEGFLRAKLLPGDFDSYMDDEVASAAVFRGGYFYPGDLAIRREDGRIRILGRLADVLIIGGLKYNAAALEEDVAGKLRVDMVCLFTAQDDATERELFVAIESDRLPANENMKSVSSMFGSIENIHFTAFPRLPRLGNGKIDRVTLRGDLIGRRARSPD